jgi:hypothetical protein
MTKETYLSFESLDVRESKKAGILRLPRRHHLRQPLTFFVSYLQFQRLNFLCVVFVWVCLSNSRAH